MKKFGYFISFISILFFLYFLNLTSVHAASVFYDSFDKSTIDTSKWTEVDTENKLTVRDSHGEIQFGAKATPAYGDPALYSVNAFSRVAGRALFSVNRTSLGTSEGPVIHFSPSTFPASPRTTGYGTFVDTGAGGSYNTRTKIVVPGATIDYKQTRAYSNDYLTATVLRSTGSYHLVSGGAFGTFPTATLVWVNSSGTDDSLYVGLNAKDGVTEWMSSVRVTDLTGSFASTDGLATAKDTFTRSDSTTLGNTETGNFAWTERIGDAEISNNAITRAGTGEVRATFNSGASDGIFEMTFTTPTAPYANAAIYFRYQDENNWFRFTCNTSSVALEKMVAGTFSTVYTTGAATCQANTTYRVVIRAHGSTIGIYLNNTDVSFNGGVTDSSLTSATGVGFGIWPSGFGTSPTIDNFYVWPKTVTFPSNTELFPTAPASSSTTLISDTFSSGTSLSTHTPDTNTPGGSWTENSGTWSISTGKVSPAAVGSIATIDTGQTNVSVSADITLGAQSEWFTGLVGRFTDTNNFMSARFLWQSASPEIEFWDTVNGVNANFCAVSLVGDVSQSTTYTMKMVVVGKKVGIYLNNTLVLECYTSNLTGTKVGMRVETGGSVNSFDNFTVTTATADAVAPPEVTALAAGASSIASNPTFTWTTVKDDAAGTSYYRVYRSTSSGSTGSQINSNNATTTGSYTDSSLSSDGTYYYTIRAVDSAGNENTLSDNNQVTVTYDTTAPVLSSVTASTTSSGATITWTSNEASSSKVDYGLTSSYGSSTTEADTSTRVTSHSVSLSGLVGCTTYHYRVRSKDNVLNERIGSDNTFTTSGCTGSASVSSQTSSSITTSTGGSLNLNGTREGITITVPTSYASSDADFQIQQLDKTSVINSTSQPSGYSVLGSHIYQLSAYTDATTSLSSFNKSITVKMFYGGNDLNNVNEGSLRIYRWDGSKWNQLSSCSVDTSAKTVSCTTSAFSVFALFAQSNLPSAPSCGDQSPGSKAPWLYGAIPQSPTSITLYFTEADNPVDRYMLEYGLNSGKYIYASSNIGGKGLRTYTVNFLLPNATYHFRIRGANGCAPGPWSDGISATTKSLIPFNTLDITSSELKSVEKAEEKSSPQCSYTVQAGDTLWSIASEKLNGGTKFKEIIDLNKDKYPSFNSSNNLSIGWVLDLGCKNIEEKQGRESLEEQEGYEVKVKVIDEKKKPIEGAKVILHSNPREAITDNQGIARFTNVEKGEHRVIIAYNNYQGEQSINLTGDVKEFNLNVQVKPTNVFTSPLVLGVIGGLVLIIIVLLVFLIRKK